jgi:hypothetical protein
MELILVAMARARHSTRFYRGVDLHARMLAVCAVWILDAAGRIVVQAKLGAGPTPSARLRPFRGELVVA